MNKIVAVILVLTGIAIGAFLTQPTRGETLNIELKYDSGYCFAIFGESITFVKDSWGYRDCQNIDKVRELNPELFRR